MFNFDPIEAQVNKRLTRYFAHKSTEENIEQSKMRLLIRSENGTVSAHIFEDGRHIRKLELKSIAESFGKEFDQEKVGAVHDYLVRTALAQKIELARLKIVICENKGKIGAYVFDEGKFSRHIKPIELLSLFYFSK